MRFKVLAVLSLSVAAAGIAAASGLSTASYRVESEAADGTWVEAGSLEISAMTPNLAGWTGSFTDTATGDKSDVRGIDSAMLNGRSGDYMALLIGDRLCLVETAEPVDGKRSYTARCSTPGAEIALQYRLTETAAAGVSLEK